MEAVPGQAERDARIARKQSLRREAELRRRRHARRVGAAGFLLAAALPVLLWHDVVTAIASEFRVEWEYLVSGWTPWFLMALGLLCFMRVMWIDHVTRESRFHTTGGSAWMGWGVSLYLLGFLLAVQVAQIAGGFAA